MFNQRAFLGQVPIVGMGQRDDCREKGEAQSTAVQKKWDAMDKESNARQKWVESSKALKAADAARAANPNNLDARRKADKAFDDDTAAEAEWRGAKKRLDEAEAEEERTFRALQRCSQPSSVQRQAPVPPTSAQSIPRPTSYNTQAYPVNYPDPVHGPFYGPPTPTPSRPRDMQAYPVSYPDPVHGPFYGPPTPPPPTPTPSRPRNIPQGALTPTPTGRAEPRDPYDLTPSYQEDVASSFASAQSFQGINPFTAAASVAPMQLAPSYTMGLAFLGQVRVVRRGF